MSKGSNSEVSVPEFNPPQPQPSDNNSEQMGKPLAAYQEKIVCFVDIKGFKNFISNSTSDPNKVVEMYEAVSGISYGRWLDFQSIFEIDNSVEEPKIQLTSFSDCTVITIDVSKEGETGHKETYFIYLVAIYIKALLDVGFLTRGGISMGSCFHYTEDPYKPDMIFGPAMLEAYELEQIHAKGPRIILHKKVKDHFDKKCSQHVNFLEKILLKDDDGPRYIDPFSYITLEKSEERKIDFLKKSKDFIEKGLDDFHHYPSVYLNYNWMRKKFNNCLDDNLLEYKIENL